YSRYRNSAGQRVRTALNIKGVEYEYITVSLDGGTPEDYRREVNSQALLPSLEIDGEIITQSTAQIEFIEETFDGPSLFPDNPIQRARSRAFSQGIACDIHPVIGPKLQRKFQAEHGFSKTDVLAWYQYWMHHGFEALEELLRRREVQTPFCYDDKPTVADIYLVPQLFNARRVGVDLSAYPLILEIDERCRALPAFDNAMPQNQPDYPGPSRWRISFALVPGSAAGERTKYRLLRGARSIPHSSGKSNEERPRCRFITKRRIMLAGSR
ncbi:MAG: maleylacetoacetate isomerase, partial [Alphaproteobacteria bacterium]